MDQETEKFAEEMSAILNGAVGKPNTQETQHAIAAQVTALLAQAQMYGSREAQTTVAHALRLAGITSETHPSLAKAMLDAGLPIIVRKLYTVLDGPNPTPPKVADIDEARALSRMLNVPVTTAEQVRKPRESSEPISEEQLRASQEACRTADVAIAMTAEDAPAEIEEDTRPYPRPAMFYLEWPSSTRHGAFPFCVEKIEQVYAYLEEIVLARDEDATARVVFLNADGTTTRLRLHIELFVTAKTRVVTNEGDEDAP